MCWSGGELAKLFTRLRQGWFYSIELLVCLRVANQKQTTYFKYHLIVIFCARPHRRTRCAASST